MINTSHPYSSEKAGVFIEKNFGQDSKWLEINQLLAQFFNSGNNTLLQLSDIAVLIERLAPQQNLTVDDFLSILGLLANSTTPFLKMSFYRIESDSLKHEIPASEFYDNLTKWWRKKSMSDDEWHEWASQIQMCWSPTELK